MPVVEHRWLEALFSPEKAKELRHSDKNEFLRAVAWYKTFKNELSIYGIKNDVLEDFIRSCEDKIKVDKDDLKKNLRRFREALYYETHIRGACKESC